MVTALAPSVNPMYKTLAIALAIACTPTAHAAKCRSGKSILYTQDWYCPSGYTDISSPMGGTVSTMGKSENVRKAEQDYLGMRAAEEKQFQNQQAQLQAQYAQEQNQLRGQCSAIDAHIRANENQQRQLNAWQQIDQLKQNHRALRDQQYRLGCHR